MVSHDAQLWMNLPYKAPTKFVPRSGLAIYLSILGLIPILTLGFVPISLVFEVKAKEIILLILSASPVFSSE